MSAGRRTRLYLCKGNNVAPEARERIEQRKLNHVQECDSQVAGSPGWFGHHRCDALLGPRGLQRGRQRRSRRSGAIPRRATDLGESLRKTRIGLPVTPHECELLQNATPGKIASPARGDLLLSIRSCSPRLRRSSNCVWTPSTLPIRPPPFADIRNARTIFNRAVADDLLEYCPFDRLGSTPPVNRDWHYVSAAELAKLMAAASSLEW